MSTQHHHEPDREGDFADGFKTALYAEGLVVLAIIVAISFNVSALADAANIIGEFLK